MGRNAHRYPGRALAATLVCLAAVWSWVAAGEATVRADCSGTVVSVEAPDHGAAQAGCEAAAIASAFLARMGLDVSSPVSLAIVRELPKGANREAIGCYLRERRTAWVLVESECSNPAAVFDLPMSPALYRSVLVHELAHAIAGANFRMDKPDVVAHEYIAYVTQLETMPEPLRERVLASYPRGSAEGAHQLNGFVYMMDPAMFAAIAWRHHRGPGGGEAFIRKVLDGRALADPW